MVVTGILFKDGYNKKGKFMDLSKLRTNILTVLSQFQHDVFPIINHGNCDTAQWIIGGLTNQIMLQLRLFEEELRLFEEEINKESYKPTNTLVDKDVAIPEE